MYIKEITIEGFKSYATRQKLNRFSPSFNAITGLNGSGKSNILDAICFVLGISNLSQVRVHNLQQLVFNMGQTGIKKASVTIVFDNSEPKTSPVGYVEHKTITVTRQVVIGGRNKYIINGRTVLKERVTNLFHSVQLNVDNPHFLIMQGHITKVVKMRPKEILNMIEETAGTSMFEVKKAKALKSIKKKDNKLKEIQSIIDESIAPSLERRKKEQEKFVEWSRNNEKAEEMKKVTIAFDVTRLKDKCEQQREEGGQIDRVRQNITESIKKKQHDIEDVQNQIKETRSSPESREISTNINEIESQLKKIGKKLISEKQLTSDLDSNIKEQESDKTRLENAMKENETKIKTLETELEKKEKELSHQTDYMEQLINKQGLLQNRIDGSTSAEQIANDSYSSQNQLIKVKKSVIRLESQIKKSDVKIQHHQEEKKEVTRKINKFKPEYDNSKMKLEKLQKELEDRQNQINNQQKKFDRKVYDRLKKNVKDSERQIRNFESKKRGITNGLGVLGLFYNPNNPYRSNPSHHGMVGNLFRIRDEKYSKALQIIAGGRLYHHIVDNDEVASKLIKSSRTRINVLPLNRIRGYKLSDAKIQAARRVGSGAIPAISCIEFDEKYRPAMNYIFGGSFIANTIDDAEKVTFDPRIKTRCVTLEGADFSPSGTLSGGVSRNARETVKKLNDVIRVENELNKMRVQQQEVNKRFESLGRDREGLEKAEWELGQARKRRDFAAKSLEESTFQKMTERLEFLEKEIAEYTEKKAESSKEVKLARKRRDDLESQVTLLTSSSISAEELKKEMGKTKRLVKKAKSDQQKTSNSSKKMKYQLENLNEEIVTQKGEIEEASSSIETAKSEFTKKNQFLKLLEKEKEKQQEKLGDLQDKQSTLSSKSAALQERKEELMRTLSNDKLNLEKLESKMSKVSKSVKDLTSRLDQLRTTHRWIEDEEHLFGKPDGTYNFEKSRMERIRKRLELLESSQRKLKLHVNRKAMINFDQQKHEYEKLLKRKRMVEKDKEEIKKTIEILDGEKREVILKTWRSVGTDFGRVFQTLLPGTDARLDAVGGDYQNGLEIHVSFGGKWKESLSELSGGQRSLLALSLILSLLLYRPAPMYILDEIDAALDPSHTRNIGSLLKNEFRKSQFIVVSLKEGMFKNAEVLFTTNFHKGTSCVKRTEGEPYEGDDDEDDEEIEDEDEDEDGEELRRKKRKVKRKMNDEDQSSSESESESDSESEDEDSGISKKRRNEEFPHGGRKRKRGRD